MNRPTTAPPSTPGGHPDPAVLAAFIDGGLPVAERRRIVDHLAACAGCYEVFAETVHFLDDEEAAAGGSRGSTGEGGAKVLVHPRARWARWAAIGLPATIAAMLAISVLPRVAELLSPAELPPARDLVARLDAGGDLGSRLGPGWEGPLPRYRGPGAEAGPGTAAGGIAEFRLGVLALDLEVALHTGGGERAAALAAAIAGRLEEVMLAEGFAADYREIAGGLERDPAGGLAAAAAAAGAADDKLAALFAEPAPLYALGQWAEAGRLAATAGERDFFADRRLRRFASRLDAAALPPALAAELEPIRELLRRPGEPDFEGLEKRFTALVSAGGPG